MNPTTRFHRLASSAACLACAALVMACAGPTVADLADKGPALELSRYLNGDLVAHGMVLDRSGRVTRRFVVDLKGRWNGDDGVLDESFRFDDGSTQQRQWRLKRLAPGRYSGRADDVVGAADGESAGPLLQWRYTLRLPVDGREYEVQFDDWMVLIDEQVLLNRAVMSKFGIRLGEVVLSFRRR